MAVSPASVPGVLCSSCLSPRSLPSLSDRADHHEQPTDLSVSHAEVHSDLFKLLMVGRAGAAIAEWLGNRLTGRVSSSPHISEMNRSLRSSDYNQVGGITRFRISDHCQAHGGVGHSRAGAYCVTAGRAARAGKSVSGVFKPSRQPSFLQRAVGLRGFPLTRAGRAWLD